VNEKDNELLCDECNSCFVEEIDKLSDAKEFNANINPRNTNTNNINTNNISFPGMINVQIFTNRNGQVQSQVINSNNNNQSNNNNNPNQIFNNMFSNMFNLFPVGNGQNNVNLGNMNINLNANNNPMFNFLHRHQNDQPFENLLNFLMMNDPNRYGTPPASKKEVENLPKVKITEENISDYKENDCLVCLCDFEIDQISAKMKCSHIFHDTCINDWLKVHNTCPVCRDEMKTDDQDYETRKNQGREALRNMSNQNTQPTSNQNSNTQSTTSQNNTTNTIQNNTTQNNNTHSTTSQNNTTNNIQNNTTQNNTQNNNTSQNNSSNNSRRNNNLGYFS